VWFTAHYHFFLLLFLSAGFAFLALPLSFPFPYLQQRRHFILTWKGRDQELDKHKTFDSSGPFSRLILIEWLLLMDHGYLDLPFGGGRRPVVVGPYVCVACVWRTVACRVCVACRSGWRGGSSCCSAAAAAGGGGGDAAAGRFGSAGM
jgi:hypothetical protein